MAFFPDLGPIDYFPLADARALRAVGWLTRGQDFVRGEVSRDFFGRLCELLVSPWQPLASSGFHECDLCRFSGGPRHLRWGDATISLGAANLFVPGQGCIYVAPSLIAHFVDAHDYSPPREFTQAVLQCPLPRTMEYKRLLLANGGRLLVP